MRTLGALLTFVTLTYAGELHQAARVCDPERMRQALSRNPRVNELDESGMTPIHVAVAARQPACVKLLIQGGADPKTRDQQGRTAFEAASKIPDAQERMKIIRALMSVSEDSEAQQPMGPMPWTLEYSVMRRQTSVTKMLLSMGADPNAVGAGGTTPLADAALKGDLEAVRLLLAHGARAAAVSRTGTQPIHDAALGNSGEVIRELVAKGANVNALTRHEAETPLHIAAAMGKLKAVETLVALGADLKLKDAKGRTPLDAAESAGMTDIAVFLKRVAAAK